MTGRMKPIIVVKRRKALNPAFKRFQNLPMILASQPPGLAIPPAVLLERAAAALPPVITAPPDNLVMMRNE